jgi:hypothetical protein
MPAPYEIECQMENSSFAPVAGGALNHDAAAAPACIKPKK